ncbi:hypothetical protein SAMN05877838_1856 [Hoeflea halophila]|uniref:Uncharacterized protein n=1 Tax=Hoeflea halophila TaxID=714899 RepID=A0A286IA48_9HYPH|nr:hypothetical protein [Hoeflea halophila]SOE16970.1 hypothetical protein SAMN05877838_1856 [Hoeflea halophila]
MIDEATLDRAVSAGILNFEQKQALVALAAGEPTSRVSPEAGPLSVDDQMRLVGGGNDIFVTVGIVLLFSGALFALQALLPDNDVALAGLLGAASWAVAEIVTRQKRMRLSSTLLALVFSASVAVILTDFIATRFGIDAGVNPVAMFALRDDAVMIGLILSGGLIAASALYFLRFKVPVLAGVAAVAATGLAFLAAVLVTYDRMVSGSIVAPAGEQLADVVSTALVIPLICGVVIFAVAVALDLHDRERQTVWSDCAFWLHVVSAPLLVHPLFILATGQEGFGGRIEPEAGAGVLLGLMMVAFVLIALAIDRRSLLAPTLAYFGSIGIYYLVSGTANSTGIPPFALILLSIGALVILFGAGWQRIRSLIIRPLLPTSLLNRLPPIKA